MAINCSRKIAILAIMAFNKLQDTWLMKFNSMAEILSLKLILNLDPVRGRGYGQLGHFANL